MSTEEVTLVAALIAALTSVITLVLSARLALLREKRLLLWQKELERLAELEELVGVAREVALSYSNPEVLEREFKAIYDKLRYAVGRFGRYSALAGALRELNHACAVTVAEKVNRGDSREWQDKINSAYKLFLKECDAITRRAESS